MAIEFKKDTKDRLVGLIQAYVEENLEIEIGRLQSEFLLEFFAKLIGPAVYNGAIGDAQAYLQGRLIDLENDLYEAEELESEPREER